LVAKIGAEKYSQPMMCFAHDAVKGKLQQKKEIFVHEFFLDTGKVDREYSRFWRRALGLCRDRKEGNRGQRPEESALGLCRDRKDENRGQRPEESTSKGTEHHFV